MDTRPAGSTLSPPPHTRHRHHHHDQDYHIDYQLSLIMFEDNFENQSCEHSNHQHSSCCLLPPPPPHASVTHQVPSGAPGVSRAAPGAVAAGWRPRQQQDGPGGTRLLQGPAQAAGTAAQRGCSSRCGGRCLCDRVNREGGLAVIHCLHACICFVCVIRWIGCRSNEP